MDAERWHEVFRCKVKLAMRSQLKTIVVRSSPQLVKAKTISDVNR